jgi:hypothetical protein
MLPIISSKKYNTLWFCFLFLIGFIAYWNGLTIPYYGDDCKYIFNPIPQSIFYFFTHPSPNPDFFRPLELVFHIFFQSHFGLNTIPLHLLQLLFHILLAFVLYLAAIKLEFTTLQAMFSSLIMLVSQTNVFTVSSGDTLSQGAGTLFGCLCLWYFYRALTTQNLLHYYASILFLLITLFFKETNISYLPAIFVIHLYHNFLSKSNSYQVSNIIKKMLPFILVCGFYFLVRAQFVSGHFEERYALQFGFGVLKNIALSLLSITLPFSSVTFVSAFKQGNSILVFTFLLFTIAFLLFVFIGLQRSQHKRFIILFSILGFINLFPPALIKNTSELYVYNAMPFFSLIIGIGIGTLLEKIQREKFVVSLYALFLVVIITSHIFAVQQKVSLMKKNGERADVILHQITPFISNMQHGGNLFLLNPPKPKIEYSIFLIRGFNVLGLNRIYHLSKRNDFFMKVLEQPEFNHYKNIEKSFFLTLNADNQVVPVFQDSLVRPEKK